MAALLLSIGAAGAFEPLHAPSQAWAPLVGLLNDWQFTRDFAVTVGNASGVVFNFQKGSMTLDTRVKTASTSKWPMAMALASAVADGTIKSLDTKANEVIPWWTKNVSDSRSMVTLRHLLSFTSGFGSGSPGGSEKPATT
uniref:Beta-lactamase-related domain-containing protein n=1 Tax=Chrysotila carterae TaxID=13221 RepID=A0A7S4BYE2_CHRCT